MVHGNVLAGTTIRSSSDVVILGNLADASVHSGGHLEVHGAIAAGEQPVDIAGTVQASSIAVRRIMAGNLRITGEVRNCEVIASGDIDIARVIGGSLTAGGRISVAVAGDRDGTTTELWAGHRLDYGTQAAAAKLAERHHEAERDRLVAGVLGDPPALADRCESVAAGRVNGRRANDQSHASVRCFP